MKVLTSYTRMWKWVQAEELPKEAYKIMYVWEFLGTNTQNNQKRALSKFKKKIAALFPVSSDAHELMYFNIDETTGYT